MGLQQSSSYTCNDCSEELHFLSEEDLDAHQFSIHWCMDCVNADRQLDPFVSYDIKQNHILCECSTSKLAGRTRGMSTYDSSTSSANIRKRFLPDAFEGHHIIGLSSDDIHHTMSNERLTFQGTPQTSAQNHHYCFDVAVPGSAVESYNPDDITSAAVTCCFEAALQLLEGKPVTTELCDNIIQRAIIEDGAEYIRSIAAVYMHERYLNAIEILLDKELPLVSKLNVEHAPSPHLSRETRKRPVSHERQVTELPPHWTSSVDAEGSKIYKNDASGVESWTPPIGSTPSFSSVSTVGTSDGSLEGRPHRFDSNSSNSSSTRSRLSSASEYVDCFDMTNIQKLKEYSQTTPLVAILTRSPNTSMVLSFDPQGDATLFIPYCESAQSCVFFGFKDDSSTAHDMLACQLFEEFPAMQAEDAMIGIRKHWNTFRMTILRGKMNASKDDQIRPSVLGVNECNNQGNSGHASPGESRSSRSSTSTSIGRTSGGSTSSTSGSNSSRHSFMLHRPSKSLSGGELTQRFSDMRLSNMSNMSGTSNSGSPNRSNDMKAFTNSKRMSLVMEGSNTSDDEAESVGYSTDRSRDTYSSLRGADSSTSNNQRCLLLNDENEALRQELKAVKQENLFLRNENNRLKDMLERV